MPRLPAISGREAVRAFGRAGWKVSRREGSHIILTKAGNPATLSIPDHRELRRGTLRSLVRNAGMRIDEFVSFLRD